MPRGLTSRGGKRGRILKMAVAHIKQSNKKDLDKEPQIQTLLKKTEEVLRAGGLHAEALTILILDFHGRLSEETH